MKGARLRRHLNMLDAFFIGYKDEKNHEIWKPHGDKHR